MTDLMFAPNFASVIHNINQELRDKGRLTSFGDTYTIDDPPSSPTARHVAENKQLVTLMRTQNYDVIRFATYRTACKLRYIQKKTNLHLVDIWNMIEAFRENGLNSMEHHESVNICRLESLLSSIFYHLNKRLPNSSQIDAEQSLTFMHNWLLSAYDPDGFGKVRVFSIKVALSTMCAGKLMDKLRYIFTQISDSSGHMVYTKFEDYLKDVLALPSAVFEKPSFGYSDAAAKSCFEMKKLVNVNDFLDTLMTEPGPQCLMWQPILNRMATVENVNHPISCEACHRESFQGFRYKCDRCYNYNLCQDCFWRGRSSGNHSNDHDVKEHSNYSSPAKELGQSLRDSFRCIPAKGSNRIPQFPEEPEKTINLTHIVPPTPPPVHNGFHDSNISCKSIGDASSMDSSSATKSPSKLLQGSIDSTRIDDEHRLIARYAARLAADANNASRSPTELNYNLDANKVQRKLIFQLEAKNRDIMREIRRLRIEQEKQAKASNEVASSHKRNPTLMTELKLLRQRRDELEARMSALQESRRELMLQLEGLMRLLKSHTSPRSSPNTSPRSRSIQSPPSFPLVRANSTPSTPGDTLSGVGGDVRQAFTQQGSVGDGSSMGGSVKSLRNDLLVAADSVTNAMSSLVRELNSEADSDSDVQDDEKEYQNESDMTLDELQAFREEMQQRLQQESNFLRELQARKHSHQHQYRHKRNGSHSSGDYGEDHVMLTDDGESYVKTDDENLRTDEEDAELYDRSPRVLIPHRYTTDEESCLETDQESYIRTDDEDGGNTDWEDAMRRWVNR